MQSNRKFYTVALIGVLGFSGMLIWMLMLRQRTEWFEELPQQFTGEWYLVDHVVSSESAIQSIRLAPTEIRLRRRNGREDTSTTYTIRRTSVTQTRSGEAGELFVFYGPGSEETITEHRLRISIGPKRKILVWSVVPTGTGEDAFFFEGEYVMIAR